MKFARLAQLVRRFFTPQCLRLISLLVGLPLLTLPASAYLVGPPLELGKLTETADIVFKGTVLAGAPVQDAWFQPVNDFGARETHFKLISVIKGDPALEKLRFRHYDENPSPGGRMYEPQFYHLEVGRTYIVFAKQTETPGVFRQLSPNHTGKEDQGVLRCADERPAVPGTTKEVLWAELQNLLRSPAPKDLLYGLKQLDRMSDAPGDFGATKDFERTETIKAIAPLMNCENPEIARTVLEVVGSRNPYMTDDFAEYWLATVGTAEIPGIGQMDAKVKNVGGELLENELMALADDHGPAANRALAIRALGRVRHPAVERPLSRWLRDPEAPVRAAAILLLADFPNGADAKGLGALSTDPAPEVRRSAAYAIGFMQQTQLAGALGSLLKDPEATVRLAASQSLLSFSPKSEAVAKVFTEQLHNEEFQPLFLNALAREQPDKFLDALATTVEGRATPKNWRGGQVPSFTAFNILFKYLQAQPAAEVRSGKLDRYLEAMEKGYVTGSSEPRDIYAFYLQRDMKERAQKYRAAAKKEAHYDLDYFFDQVDRAPATYTR